MLNAPNRSRPESIDLAREPAVRIGNAWLRPADRVLERNGTAEPLEPRVAQLLVALIKARGRTLGREELIDLCWGGRIVGEDAINHCVAKARRSSAGAGFEIETVPRVGYRLVEKRAAAGRWKGRSPFILLIALGLAAAAAFFFWPKDRTGPKTVAPVAVAKFTTTAADPTLIARTGEIDDQIIHVLANLGFSASAAGPTGVKKARYRVSGTVARQPLGLLARVQIADVRSGTTIMSQELELDSDETPLLPDKVAALVGDALTRSGVYYALTDKSADPRETASFLAIELQIADGKNLEADLQARRLFARYPNSRVAPYAVAHAAVHAFTSLPLEDRLATIARGREAASTAQSRLPNFGDAYIPDCWLYPVDFAACERIYRKALQIDPSPPSLRSYLAFQLMHSGRLHEAAPLAQKSLADNPFNPSAVNHRLYLTELMGRPTEERETWLYAQRYWPKARFARQRFFGLMASGRWREAETMKPLVVRLMPESREILRDLFAALNHPDATSIMRASDQCGSASPGTFVACFTGLSMLGRPDAAIDVALRAFPKRQGASPAETDQLFVRNGHDGGGLFLLWGDGAKRMRQEPRFATLAERTGLLAYWKSSGGPDFCEREQAPVCELIGNSRVARSSPRP